MKKFFILLLLVSLLLLVVACQNNKDAAFYLRTAVSNKDVAFCQRIPANQTIESSCNAPMTASLKPCPQENYRDRCYSQMAVATEDAALCDKIIKPEEKDACYFSLANALKDYNFCLKIEGKDKDFCLSKMVVYTLDEKLCEMVQNNVWKNNCLQYIAKAKPVCQMIEDNKERGNCIDKVFNSGPVGHEQ